MSTDVMSVCTDNPSMAIRGPLMTNGGSKFFSVEPIPISDQRRTICRKISFFSELKGAQHLRNIRHHIPYIMAIIETKGYRCTYGNSQHFVQKETKQHAADA